MKLDSLEMLCPTLHPDPVREARSMHEPARSLHVHVHMAHGRGGAYRFACRADRGEHPQWAMPTGGDRPTTAPYVPPTPRPPVLPTSPVPAAPITWPMCRLHWAAHATSTSATRAICADRAGPRAAGTDCTDCVARTDSVAHTDRRVVVESVERGQG